MAYTKSHRFEYHPKLRGRGARTPDSAGGGPRARGGWRQVASAPFLYFVSVFGGDFGNLWSFLLEIAVFGMNSGESPEKFPKITKMLSKNGKSPTSTGARPPSLTRSGVRRAPVELGHSNAAGVSS